MLELKISSLNQDVPAWPEVDKFDRRHLLRRDARLDVKLRTN